MEMLAAGGKGNFARCLELASDMKAAGLEPELATYASLMMSAGVHAASTDGWAILEDMLSLGIKPNADIMNNLIKVCLLSSRAYTRSLPRLKAQQLCDTSHVWKVIQKMDELQIAFDEKTYSLLMRRFSDSNNFEMALQYLLEMKRKGMMPEFKVVQMMICYAALLGYPKLAIDLITWYEHETFRHVESVSWMTCLMSSAESLYVSLQSTYTMLSLINLSQMDGTLHCWQTVVHKLNLRPSEGTCLAVLDTAARHGLTDLGADVLRVLKLIGVQLEEHHFAGLVEAFCQKSEIKEALQVLEIMRSNGIEPRPETAFPMLSTMSTPEDLDTTWAIIDELHTSGVAIDPAALHVLIKASIDLGDLQRAIGAYKNLSDYGISADIRIFNLLLTGCIAASHRALGDRLLADMKEAKVKPNSATYDNIITLCLTQADYEDAFFYLEEMKSARHKPFYAVYEKIVRKCLSANDPRYKVALEELREIGYHPSRHLMAELERVAKKPKQDHDVIAPEPVTLDGTAQRFIDSGGLEGAVELPSEHVEPPKEQLA